MSSLLLDTDAWDLVLDSAGDWAVCEAPYSVAQDVACAIRTIQGEQLLAPGDGLPRWDVLTGPQNAAFLASHVEPVAQSVPGVASASLDDVEFANRSATGTINMTMSDGASASVSL